MSIKSYQRNVELGVAGPHSSTCFPAALEQMAESYGYKPHLYEEYSAFGEWYNGLSEKGRRSQVDYFEDVIEDLVQPLGGLALQDVIFKRVVTASALARAAHNLSSAGYGVVVDISYGPPANEPVPHGVGLIPVQKNYYTLVSTHVPRALQGIVSIDEIAKRLQVSPAPPIPGHPIYSSNLTAVPIV